MDRKRKDRTRDNDKEKGENKNKILHETIQSGVVAIAVSGERTGGNEFWNARDLAKILEYSEFRHFLPVISKAQESCENSNHKLSDHFEDILDMVDLGKGAKREIESLKLSRKRMGKLMDSV